MKVRKNTKEWDKIKKRLLAKKQMLNVGWFQGQTYGPDNDNLPLAQVAKWVEEGHREGFVVTPPRPAIRVKFMPDLIQDKAFRMKILQGVAMVADGKSNWKKMHEFIAPDAVALLKKTLKLYNDIPNSPVTIEIKGFNDPWIYTGTLVNAVDYKIEDYKKYQGGWYK